MNKTKLLISLVLAASVLFGQVGGVLAAPVLQHSTSITGRVQSITLATDPNTGITTVIIEVIGADQATQTVRISQTSAAAIGLVTRDDDGNPVINNLALGQSVEIDPAAVIPDQQKDPNPVGNALATFFSDIPGLDYETIMAAYEEGVGFAVIAQALWLTKQVEGEAGDFHALLTAKETGDYTAFTLEDGTVPQNWAQLRKAILDGKKPRKTDQLTSDPNNAVNQQQDKDKKKDKDKNKNKDNGNNGNNKDKEKDK
jgi:hypothetical protein